MDNYTILNVRVAAAVLLVELPSVTSPVQEVPKRQSQRDADAIAYCLDRTFRSCTQHNVSMSARGFHG